MRTHEKDYSDVRFFPEQFGDASFCLSSGEVLDHESDNVQAFVEKALRGTSRSNRSSAIGLYYAVRDGLFYEIFDSYVGARLSASVAIAEGRGFCLHKAIVYAATCRAAGVPCRVLAATVRNHISSPSISALVGGDVFLHWYNEVLLDGEWLKAAPIFNKLTCKLYGIEPLEFDGLRPAAAQPYYEGRAMTFLTEPVSFDNPLRSDILSLIRRYHPTMLMKGERVPREIEVREAHNNGSGKIVERSQARFST